MLRFMVIHEGTVLGVFDDYKEAFHVWLSAPVGAAIELCEQLVLF